jgi:hypothetical protein
VSSLIGGAGCRFTQGIDEFPKRDGPGSAGRPTRCFILTAGHRSRSISIASRAAHSAASLSTLSADALQPANR